MLIQDRNSGHYPPGHTKLIAITTVHGCVKVEQATANVVRVQRANLLKKLIPVYMGASEALIRRKSLLMYPRTGTDGIGDRPDLFPQVSPTDFTMHEAEPAALALIRLTTEHDGVTLVCIGPLTNVALAYKIDNNFAKRLRTLVEIVIFGGNHFGSIVSDAAFTESNFGADPEAAKIVMEEMNTPITMVPWDYAYAIGNHDGDIVDFQAHLKIDTPLASFLALATNIGVSATFKHARQDGHGEEIAVAIAINEKAIATATDDSRLGVELSDEKRGQVTGDFCMLAVVKDYGGSLPAYLAAHPVDQSRSIIHTIIHYDVEKLDE
nr:Inosine uridine-preferring nucleoside hydrolase domain containing protein [Haemonchus contortus]